MPNADMFESIADAYAFVVAGHANRIDGAGWSVYKVGANVVRIDVRLDKRAPDA
jgi:hypothetical protein